MGKVRYKEPSNNLKKIASSSEKGMLRASLGREQAVGEFYHLSIGNLIPYEKQARKHFNEEEIKQLASTIEKYGIRSPLHVIPSEKYIGKHEVVSGERRLRAAQLLGLEKVPCIIIKNNESVEEIGLIENIQRSDLHPIELANSLASLLQFSNWGDISNIAERIGKPQSTISEHLAYAKLPEKIKAYLLNNNIKSRATLRTLLKQESEVEMAKFLGLAEGGKKLALARKSLRFEFDGVTLKNINTNLIKLNPSQRTLLKDELIKVIQKIKDLEHKNST